MIVHRLAHIICSWILGRKDVVLDDVEKQWVEFGFARFRDLKDSSSERAVIDEPLIILAAAQHLNTDTTVGLVNHVLNGLGSTGGAGRGTKLEELVAVYLVEAFGPSVRLCDVFDFGEDIPIWAQSEGVELVALSSDGDYHVVNCSPADPVATSSALGCFPKNASETVEWFRDPYTVPDIYLGPDLVLFIRLSNCSGEIPISVGPTRRCPRLYRDYRGWTRVHPGEYPWMMYSSPWIWVDPWIIHGYPYEYYYFLCSQML